MTLKLTKEPVMPIAGANLAAESLGSLALR